MRRSAEQNRVVKNGNDVAVEQTRISDDNLLPEVAELKAIQEIDPKMIDWILKRTEIEQDARIKFNNNKMKLMNKSLNQSTFINFSIISCIFVILLSFILISAYLIYINKGLEGTIFGSATMLLAYVLFHKWERPKSE